MYINFKQKTITPAESLGEFLKKNREKKNITLEEIARKTKIRLAYLEALENNEYEKLPHEAYTRGILKKYSEIVQLNYKKILSFYHKEKGLINDSSKSNIPVPPSIKNPRIIITPKTYLIIFTLLIFLSIIIYISYQFRHFTAPPLLTIKYPPDNLVVKKETINIEGETNPGTSLLINEQNIPLNNKGCFKTKVNLQNGINFIKIVAKNRLNKETVVTRKVLAKIPPKITQSPPLPTSLELTVQINPNTAWVYIEGDGKRLYQGIMLPGTSQTFHANNYFNLSTRNAGSVEIIFNGKNLGKLGQEQQIIQGLKLDKNTKIE